MPILPYREPEIIGSCQELGSVFKKENLRSVLIVTDKGIVNNGLVAPLEEVLRESGVSFTVYDKTQPNPTVDNVEEALLLYRQNNCDTLIAIGGGSSTDCAKALGARVAYIPEVNNKENNACGKCRRHRRNIHTELFLPKQRL